MGVSIYYTAERTTALTQKEQIEIDSIIEQYNSSFKYTDDAESFDLYDYDDTEPDTIIAGATKMPSSMDIDVLMHTIEHWLQCLTEIRHAVADAEWHVHLDDSDALWINDQWQMSE